MDSVCKDAGQRMQCRGCRCSVFMIIDEIAEEFGRGLRFIDGGGDIKRNP